MHVWCGKRTGDWFVYCSNKIFLLSSYSDCGRCGFITCQTCWRKFLCLLNKSLSVANTSEIEQVRVCVRERGREQILLAKFLGS